MTHELSELLFAPIETAQEALLSRACTSEALTEQTLKHIQESEEFITSNILGVQNLLELIRRHKTNISKTPVYIQISTDEVYGDIKNGRTKENHAYNPSCNHACIHGYG